MGSRWEATKWGQPCHVLACFGLIFGFYFLPPSFYNGNDYSAMEDM